MIRVSRARALPSTRKTEPGVCVVYVSLDERTAGGNPDSGATEAGPDAYSLSSTYHTSFRANGIDDVVFRFAPYSETAVHRQIWGMNGFVLSEVSGPTAMSESTSPLASKSTLPDAPS